MKVRAKRNLFIQTLGSIKEGNVFEVDEKTAKTLGSFVEIIGRDEKIKKTKEITAKDKESVDIITEKK